VKAAGLELEWRSGRDADEAPFGIELVDQGQQVELVGTAAVQEHQRTFGLAPRGALVVDKQVDVSAHRRAAGAWMSTVAGASASRKAA
jgi:hypothetical protein